MSQFDTNDEKKHRMNLFFLWRILLGVMLSLNLLLVHEEARASEDVVQSVLKNGLRVIIVRNVVAPVVTTQVNYIVGANEDPPGLPGMAHAQEHMMFRGSPGLIAGQLSAISAALGGESNADTQQTVTQYFFTVPAEYLDVVLRVEAIRMQGILDSQELWESERGAIDQEVAQDLSNPEYVFYIKLLKEMFAGTPYETNALGTQASFKKMTGKMLSNFHKNWYGPNNAVLVIVGNVSVEKTLKTVKQLFESIPARPTPGRSIVQLKPLKGASIHLETDLPYGLAIVAYRLPGYDSPDYAAGQILADVLGSKRGNLYALVPQGKALSVEFNLEPLPKAAIGFVTAAFPKGDDGALLVSKLKNVVAEYMANGFPADLMEAAKNQEIAENEFQRNSVEGLASLWSQAVAIEGRKSSDDDISAMKKVTIDDIKRVAREYLVNDTAITAVLEPLPSGSAFPSERAKGKESFSPKQAKHDALPLWAKKATSLQDHPASFVNPEVTALSNGLRLIILSNNASSTVSVYGRVRNNPYLQVPEGQEGVDQVMNQLFSYGTTTLDRLAFQKALDDIAARESAGTSFSLQVLTEHFDKGMQLLADNMLHPAFPVDAFNVAKQETIGSLHGLLESPSYLSRRALYTALYPKDDPKLRQAVPDTVARLNFDDVKNYYGRVFRADMTTIVVIGQISPAEAKSIVSKYFGEWKSTGPKPVTDLPAVRPNKPSSVEVPDRSRIQDDVTLAQTLGIKRSDPDYYALQVGRHILTGAFYATRLYQDLREKTGLVYTVEALLDVGKTRSGFAVFYACDPQNVSRARAIVEHDLSDMQKHLVTPKELNRAKILLLRQITLAQASTGSIAEKLLSLSLEDMPLDEPITAAEKYTRVTAAEVRNAFLKWIRPNGFAQVVQGPNPE
jgi:zinc protease